MTKSLLSKTSLVKPIPYQLPSPPPEGQPEPDKDSHHLALDPEQLQKFHEDILLDFAALESSITRIQLIQSSNQRERERYAAEKARIIETAQAVRDNTVQLRLQLAEAQRVLQLRKGYDDLAAKILDDKKLKSRDESKAEIEKLEKEIEDLEQESAEFENTWHSRREQFDSVVAEGETMIRLIKGIKDEPEAEKDDQMDDAEELEAVTKAENSRAGSPAPDGRSPRALETGDMTPLPDSGDAGDATPARPTNRLLDVDDATRSNSHVASPLVHAMEPHGDVDMADSPALEQIGVESQPGKISDSGGVSTPADENLETMDES